MPLPILLILVVGGIAAIALLLHLSGKSRRLVMSPEDARSAWHRHFPDDTIREALITPDGHAALILTDQGPGLVWAMGLGTAARHLLDVDLIDTPDGLTVMFHDFTAPNVTLHLPEDMRARWLTLMAPA